jgi:MoxR-like ATPase
VELDAVCSATKLLQLRTAIEAVHVDPDLEDYIARLVHATRADRRVAVGASPRASLAFLKMARSYAALNGREYVLPDDIKHFAVPILTHRIILSPEYWVARDVTGAVIADVLARTSVPVIEGA